MPEAKGIDSLKEWGSTLCELPKVKKLNLSYEQLTQRAMEGDTIFRDYLIWWYGPGAKVSRMVEDLVNYVKAIGLTKEVLKGSQSKDELNMVLY